MPNDARSAIQARAAAAGMSVVDYLLDERAQQSSQPSLDEVIARAQARPGGVSRAEIVRVIREARDDPGRL